MAIEIPMPSCQSWKAVIRLTAREREAVMWILRRLEDGESMSATRMAQELRMQRGAACRWLRQLGEGEEFSRVYYIEGAITGAIKIGVSVDPVSRMGTLQTASSEPLRLLGSEPGGYERERELHDRFAAFRRSGEWFDPNPELVSHIESIRNAP